MQGMHDLEKEAFILQVKHNRSYQGLLGLFSIIVCLAKPDDMLTKEIKYRYKIAIFYRFLKFSTLPIPIPIFALE